MRIDKAVSSQSGHSRSDVRKLVSEGRITINGIPAAKPSDTVDPEKDDIRVDDQPLNYRTHLYLMLNKPTGVISATEDTRHKTVLDLIPDELKRRGLFPAGRLDADTTGLMLITDDGDLTHRILAPKSHVSKTYIAELADPLSAEDADRIREGITLGDGTECLPAELEKTGEKQWKITLYEGKYHEIKRMFGAVGNKVTALKRISMGALMLDSKLEEGCCREMTEDEVELLKKKKK